MLLMLRGEGLNLFSGTNASIELRWAQYPRAHVIVEITNAPSWENSYCLGSGKHYRTALNNTVNTMADTLLFIHGTGVRQEGYDQTMKLLTEGLAKVGLDAKVEGLCWGSDLGTKVDDEAIRAVLPLSLTKSATPSPEDLGWQAALWTALLDDPLVELRMAAMREPPRRAQLCSSGRGTHSRRRDF